MFFGKLTARFEKIPRCHTGHSFSVLALLTSQSEKIEETLWASLRMFEERKNLQNNIAQQQSQVKGKSPAAQRAKETQVHIERIKAMLLAQQSKTWQETFTRVEKIRNLPRVAVSAERPSSRLCEDETKREYKNKAGQTKNGCMIRPHFPRRLKNTSPVKWIGGSALRGYCLMAPPD